MNDANLPSGLLASMAASSNPRALFLRHSDRYDIPDGDSGASTPLTSLGEQRAQALGVALGDELSWAVSSPLLRCVRTAELMGKAPTPSSDLGAPGPFVVDRKVGGKVFGEIGTHEVVRGQIKGETWGCMRPLNEGVGRILRLLRSMIASSPGVGVAVSHDAIVMPFIAWATGYGFEDDWLEPLDGIVVCQNAVVWRGKRYEVK